MALSEHELAELHKRVQYAHYNGFSVAKAAEYVEALGGDEPPAGVVKHSTGHLLSLVTKHVTKHVPNPVPAKPGVSKVVKPVVQTKPVSAPPAPVKAPTPVKAPAPVQTAPVEPQQAATQEPAAPAVESPSTTFEHDTSTPKVVDGD